MRCSSNTKCSTVRLFDLHPVPSGYNVVEDLCVQTKEKAGITDTHGYITAVQDALRKTKKAVTDARIPQTPTSPERSTANRLHLTLPLTS